MIYCLNQMHISVTQNLEIAPPKTEYQLLYFRNAWQNLLRKVTLNNLEVALNRKSLELKSQYIFCNSTAQYYRDVFLKIYQLGSIVIFLQCYFDSIPYFKFC